jgi:hypothetical protein
MRTAVSVALLMLVGYLASYSMFVSKGGVIVNAFARKGRKYPIPASYCYGDHGVEKFYSPAHWLDRRLRPGYWNWTKNYSPGTWAIDTNDTFETSLSGRLR